MRIHNAELQLKILEKLSALLKSVQRLSFGFTEADVWRPPMGGFEPWP